MKRRTFLKFLSAAGLTVIDSQACGDKVDGAKGEILAIDEAPTGPTLEELRRASKMLRESAVDGPYVLYCHPEAALGEGWITAEELNDGLVQQSNSSQNYLQLRGRWG